MKKILLYLFVTTTLFINGAFCFAGDGNGWQAKMGTSKSFIENKGQFQAKANNSPVLFAVDNGPSLIYFTPSGLTYTFLKRWKKKETENEREHEKEELKKGISHAELEAEEHKMEYKTDVVNMFWENSNPNCELIAEDATTDYHSYSVQRNGIEKNITNIKGYKKLIYKNLYPNIDVEYIFHPAEGLKYSLILHPGADLSQVKMKYSNAVALNKNGEILIATAFGSIIDHTPVTFYAENKSQIISSKFIRNGKSVSFSLGDYDNSKTVIIDPWTQTPSLSNSNSVWECEHDGAGNVYILGGDTPMKILKYNPAGALQWTYNTTWDTANYWLGTFAVDLPGNSYVTSGTHSKISKVNTSGGNVWTNNNIGGNSQELWNITFNCDQTRLIIGGTAGLLTLRGAIFDLDVNNGNVLTTKIVGYNKALTLGANAPDEVRSICSAPNGKYYFLILDSIGRISQNFTACPSNTSLYKTTSTYDFAYYNPSYRYDNSGIMAIRANRKFVYTQNGSTVSKRSLSNLNAITTVAIAGGINVSGGFGNPGTAPGNSGLDVDSCGNVYVGSGNSVIKYDANLNVVGTVALPFTVFDVSVSINGDVIVAGSTTQSSGTRTGYVQSVSSFAACWPMPLSICCDASVCNVNPMCANAASVTLQPATPGGTWSGAGVNASTGVFNPATAGAGTHTIIYTLPCGSDSISITVNACVMSACQNSNGTITASLGTAPYSWQNQVTTTDCSGCPFGMCSPPFCSGTTVTTWTTFTTGTTITPSGTYPIRLIDNAGATLIINSLASLPNCTSCAALTITPSAQINVNCFGQSTGSINISASGGAGPYDYTLMNGATTVATFTNIAGTQSFTGLPAGTYTLNVADNNGCPGSTTITITQPASALTSAITGSTNTSCGGNTGSATAQASGGSSPYDYVWSNGSGTLQTTNNITGPNTLSGLASGTYTVTVTDNNGCTASTTTTISSTGGATVAVTSQTNVLCFGATTGDATATASGGSSPYDYVWTGTAGTLQTTNNIAGPNILSGLAAGTYSVTVTDNSGCTSNSTVTITQPANAASVVITGTIPAACGSSNGSATAQASGGSSPYNYVWSNGTGTLQTTNNVSGPNTLNNVAAGTYTITITDNNGCTTFSTATISNSGGATTSITAQTNVSCFGGSTGSATANTTGGTSPYDYVWTGTAGTLQTTNNITVPNTLSAMAAGTYTVTVTDNGGCISSQIVIITQPASALNVSTNSVTNTSCGLNNGAVSTTATGGTIGTGYLYSWAPSGGSNSNANGLAAGTYTLTVTDANGCAATTNATINASTGVTATITSQTGVTCNGGNNGTATVSAGGGTGTYTYSWSGGGGSSATANGLSAGTYTVSVTSGGCTATGTATISGPNAIIASVNTTATTCGASIGTATVTANGGTGTLTYLWSVGGTSQTINNLNAGSVSVTITDQSGCTQIAAGTVGTTGTIAVNAGTDVTIIAGTSTTLVGTAPAGVSYNWSPSSTLSCSACASPVASPLQTTTYTLTVTQNGCSSSDTVTVFVDIKCGELYVPTGFSPNGDGNGNDNLKVYGNCITQLYFAVFDRWGEKVFETTDPSVGWDGTYKGKKLDAAVFAYFLKATVDGIEVKKQGNITLIK